MALNNHFAPVAILTKKRFIMFSLDPNRTGIPALNTDQRNRLTKDVFINLERFKYSHILDGESISFAVPAGFVFAPSQPAFTRAFVSMPNLALASCLHDMLYFMKGDSENNPGVILLFERKLTRRQVDQLFYKDLLAQGVKKWKAKAAYYAVRAGGWYYWRKKFNPDSLVMVNLGRELEVLESYKL